jgi:hypothetical protein
MLYDSFWHCLRSQWAIYCFLLASFHRFGCPMPSLATLSSTPLKFLRNTMISTIGRLPFVQEALAERLSEIIYR